MISNMSKRVARSRPKLKRKGASVMSEAKIKKLERENEAKQEDAVVESTPIGTSDTNGQV